MTMRTKRNTVTFVRPFSLKDIGRTLPAGAYEVVTDEELIEGLSFPVYRRVSTMIMAPAPHSSSIEMLIIDPRELQAALNRDAAPHESQDDDGADLGHRPINPQP
ncbi:hypothetical protein [Rhodoplanes sp. Z2-YC6860]|uniref:hypothetical protein n=1 Tax=Rhodoplanes sp. Z2-YC6860 TaxID=674703 RepID=UPI00078BCB6E|nr:hypothetical protein [Rhodoplanes sp. Z2-YC6860]AMN39068.1 hypothetical protein RHPLAN_06050 [Rhodoplanes sp. Z2-YC6860]